MDRHRRRKKISIKKRFLSEFLGIQNHTGKCTNFLVLHYFFPIFRLLTTTILHRYTTLLLTASEENGDDEKKIHEFIFQIG